MSSLICVLTKITIDGTSPADDNLLHDRLAQAVGAMYLSSSRSDDGLDIEVEATFRGDGDGVSLDVLVAHYANLQRRVGEVLAARVPRGCEIAHWHGSTLHTLVAQAA